MSERPTTMAVNDPDHLQARVLALGQAALEGNRPLSDLLGDAFLELRSAAARVREQETEIRRKDERIAELQREMRTVRDRPERHRGEAVPADPGPGALDPSGLIPHAEGPSASTVPLRVSIPAEGSAGLEASLRRRIATARYLGTLSAGDRLPSIREVARTTGLNHKVVRRVYRALERSGVVEVRDRSGTYVPEVEVVETLSLDPLESWTAGILVGAVGRGLAVRDLSGLLDRMRGASGLKCYCVDSTEDDRFALCNELRQSFGLETVPVEIGPDGLKTGIADADVVVTTPFHVDEVRRALSPGQPLVVATLHPSISRTLREALEGGTAPVRLLCVDRASGERLLGDLDPVLARRAEVVTIGSLTGEDELHEPGVATVAARAQSGGRGAVPPYLSPRTVEQMAKLLVRLTSE